MMMKYDQLWPEHPFRFRIPYQNAFPAVVSGNQEYVKTPENIKSTVLSLLEDLDDEEFIYWCLDDKYPIELDVERVEGIYNWIKSEEAKEVDGILFCRCRRMWDQRYLTAISKLDKSNFKYLERRGYEQIWIHQFIRVKVLRYLFESFPDEIPSAKLMDEYKRKLAKPESHRIFVCEDNYTRFGESTSRGKLTKNCHQSILESGLDLPSWYSGATDKEILIGSSLLSSE